MTVDVSDVVVKTPSAAGKSSGSVILAVRCWLIVNVAQPLWLHPPIRRPAGAFMDSYGPPAEGCWLPLQTTSAPRSPGSLSEIQHFGATTYGANFTPVRQGHAKGNKNRPLTKLLTR